MPNFVVVDVETTGLGKSDRIVEISAVLLDGQSFDVIDEFDTLVNPLRDVGPTAIHGVTASMVESAPTFEEVSIALGNLLEGNIFVAHNISFDSRFIESEYRRLEANFQRGTGLCTLRLSNEKLASACARYGIQIEQAHRALSDARATAQLLKCTYSEEENLEPVHISNLSGDWTPLTIRRDLFPGNLRLPIVRELRSLRFPTSDERLITYLDVLDAYLDDLVLTQDEKNSLREFADELGIDERLIPSLHDSYLRAVIHAAQRDGRISDFEHDTMIRIAQALELPVDSIPDVSATKAIPSDLVGLRVCFTGEPVVDGEVISRGTLESIAANAGLQPVSDVTKKGCDLLVAADTSSMSGKAKKAQAWGIPVMSVSEFVNSLKQG